MKFELSKKECDIIINALYVISREEVFEDNVLSGEPMQVKGISIEYSIGKPEPSVIKIINKLKRGKHDTITNS